MWLKGISSMCEVLALPQTMVGEAPAIMTMMMLTISKSLSLFCSLVSQVVSHQGQSPTFLQQPSRAQLLGLCLPSIQLSLDLNITQ